MSVSSKKKSLCLSFSFQPAFNSNQGRSHGNSFYWINKLTQLRKYYCNHPAFFFLTIFGPFYRTLPALVWHRQDWSIVSPFTSFDEAEIKELKRRPAFVAGFIDPTVEERTDLYDIFVNCKKRDFFYFEKRKDCILRFLVISGGRQDM